MEILFTHTLKISDYFKPTPALEIIPEWYKKLESYFTGEKKPHIDPKHKTTATVKRCMPVFDAITAGYIFYTPVDVYVEQINNTPYYSWPAGDALGFHPIEQVGNHPLNNGFDYPKWNNPWAIKTPKGYSVLVLPPLHRESVFTILEGIVDTDTYTAPINFPFVLNDIKYEGMIPAGTPIAQIIPFKRENWVMKIGGEKEKNEVEKINLAIVSKYFDRYKTLFRQTKEYK